MARQKGLREQTEVILDGPAAFNRGSQCLDMLRRIHVCHLTEKLLMRVEAKLASSGSSALTLSPLGSERVSLLGNPLRRSQHSSQTHTSVIIDGWDRCHRRYGRRCV